LNIASYMPDITVNEVTLAGRIPAFAGAEA